MTGLVADTHAIVWYLQRSLRLSAAARAAMEMALSSGGVIYVSVISLTEVLFLEEKQRLSNGTLRSLLEEMKRGDAALVEVPLVGEIVETMQRIPRETIPELPDRIIAATALHLDLPLVTADSRISASGIRTIW